jgi:hypothetical protein
MEKETDILEEIVSDLADGRVVPYLGPGIFHAGADFPVSHHALVEWFCTQVSVPGRFRDNLSAAAQYIENFKHRKTLVRLMQEAFQENSSLTRVHRFLAGLPSLPLVVDTWYDGTTAKVLSHGEKGNQTLCQISGISHADEPGGWFRVLGDLSPEEAETVLYKPYGSVYPEPRFVVSDSDYVEVLTEIDIQTPIPPAIQRLRSGRHFLFLGCRFNHQLARIFGQQIMKRSSDRHWMVLPDEPTPKEARFMARQNIIQVKMDPDDFIRALSERIDMDREVGCKSV